jgi:uncharacterized protein (DUF608 family)
MMTSMLTSTLFPTHLPELQWTEFEASGFAQPVSGVIYRTGQPPCCGVALGGISTGCLDVDTRGIYGWSSIFNPWMQHPLTDMKLARKMPAVQPVLGLAVAGKVWVMTTQEMLGGGQLAWCTEPYNQERDGKTVVEWVKLPCPKIEGVQPVKDIHYWGHYPVADLEYETDAPVSVGMRAWAPFIPGDAAASNIPAAVFELHLRNTSAEAQRGTIVFNCMGPDADEARATEFTRTPIDEDIKGVLVGSAAGITYVLGTIGQENARFGAGFEKHPAAWANIGKTLPQPAFREVDGAKLYQESGCSAAIDFDLQPGAERIMRLALAWYAPEWQGITKNWEGVDHVVDDKLRLSWVGSPHAGDTHYFTHMYAARYASALEVARRVAVEHESLLRRVLAWQQVIYAEATLPAWLRDSLVNNLYLMAETSYWAMGKPPLEDWAFPGGVFAMNESPRGCPHISCIPCDWYGNLPSVFFFPELARTNLRGFKQYQRHDGEIPFAIGKIDKPDFAVPEYYWQVSLNGMCYVDMVDRLWQATGDDEVLREFYDSVKRTNTYTMRLSSKPGAPIRMPDVGGMEWFEIGEWAGMASHVGMLRLAELRMARRMAEAMSDTEYAQQCEAWLAEGTQTMEEQMWAGSYYLNFCEPETGRKSDDVMGYQLDGEWASVYHGLGGVCRPERAKLTLETIKRCNVALTPEIGAANFARPDGNPLAQDSKVAEYGAFAMFPPEVLVLAMTYIYAGEKDFGVELARKHWANFFLKQRHPWDLANIVRGDTGKRLFGTDYYQDMMLWALPAAIEGQDIRQSNAPGGLIDRVIKAGKA